MTAVRRQLTSTTRLLPNAPTVLFIHGSGGSSSHFCEAARYLEGFSIVIPDLPGFGLSGSRPSYSYKESIDDLTSLTDLLEIGHFGVVGHSSGADLAIQWAATTKRIDSVLAIEPTFLPFGMGLQRAAVAAANDLSAADWLSRFTDPSQYSSSPKVQSALARSLEQSDPAAILQLAKDTVALADEVDGIQTTILKTYQRLKQRRLSVFGGKSDGTHVPILKSSGLTTAQDIETWGHWPMLEEPSQFYELVLTFFNEDCRV